MKKFGRAMMLVQQPGGGAVMREILLTFDDQSGGSFEVEITGESPLKGYSFLVKQRDLKAVRDSGKEVR
jgi:hypothetical protein